MLRQIAFAAARSNSTSFPGGRATVRPCPPGFERRTTFTGVATERTDPLRWAVVLVVALLHLVAALWMLRPAPTAKWPPSREKVLQVDWITVADAIAAPPALAPAVVQPAPMPLARPATRAPSALLSAAEASPFAASTVAASAPAEAAEDTPVAPAEFASPALTAASAAQAAPHAETSAARLATPALPRDLPAESVRYLVPPAPVYPRLSRQQGETGRVQVRVYIDEAGLPRTVQLSASSGHGRLDEAALQAVLRARFKPYTENGSPMGGWALIPLTFDLEK